MVECFKGRNTLISDVKGDLNLESDCEGDLTGVGLEAPGMEEEEKEETRAVLITGSFSAYVRFFTSYWHWND